MTKNIVISPANIFNCQNLIVILAFLSIGWVLFISMYTSPSVDDFCFAYWTKTNGVLGAVKFAYVEANGRFTASLLITSFTYFKTIFINGYFLVPLLILFCIFFSSRAILKAFEVANLKFSVIFFAIFLSSFSFRQTIFWLAGGFTYTLSICLFIILSVLEFQICSSSAGFKKFRIAGISLLAFFLSGFNETIMAAHLAFTVTLLFLAIFLRRSKGIIFSLALILIFALFGAVVSVISPGNAIRVSVTPHDPQFLSAVFNTIIVVLIKYWKSWATAFFVFYSAMQIIRPQIKFYCSNWLVYVTSLFCALISAVFLRMYILGNLGPPRAQIVDHVLISIISFMVALNVYRGGFDVLRKTIGKMQFSIFILLICLLGRVGPDGVSYFSTLKNMQYAINLNYYMSMRNRKLDSSKELDVAYKNFSGKERSSTFFDDIQGDSLDWRNRCVANYFDLKRVYLIN